MHELLFPSTLCCCPLSLSRCLSVCPPLVRSARRWMVTSTAPPASSTACASLTSPHRWAALSRLWSSRLSYLTGEWELEGREGLQGGEEGQNRLWE